MAKQNNRYRILLVVRWPVGGIRTFLRYVYNNFDPTAYELTIIAPNIEELRVLIEDLKDFHVEYVPSGSRISGTRLTFMVARALLTKKFDLIHSQGFTSGLCSALPAKVFRTRHLMTSHDILQDKQLHGFKGSVKRLALSRLLPMIDVIHSVSNDAQNNLVETIPSLAGSSSRSVVILNGIDTGRFTSAGRRDFRKELDIADDSFLIGFLGRFMSQKGLIYLVDAIEQLYDSKRLDRRPVVLTFGGDGFIREDMDMIRRRGLEGHFRFLPFCANIAETLRGLDVVAIPSLWEACPLLPMEAMVAGVPLIGTDCIGLREVLRGTPSRVVPAANSKALADAIVEEMQHPTRVEAESFSAEAAKRFDVKKQAEEVEKLITDMIAGKKG